MELLLHDQFKSSVITSKEHGCALTSSLSDLWVLSIVLSGIFSRPSRVLSGVLSLSTHQLSLITAQLAFMDLKLLYDTFVKMAAASQLLLASDNFRENVVDNLKQIWRNTMVSDTNATSVIGTLRWSIVLRYMRKSIESQTNHLSNVTIVTMKLNRKLNWRGTSIQWKGITNNHIRVLHKGNLLPPSTCVDDTTAQNTIKLSLF